MRILNARVVGDSGFLVNATIQIKRDKITRVTYGANFNEPQAGDLDAQDWVATPGWLDIQINGGFGFDFTSNPASIWEVAALLPGYGVTGFLPTIISAPAEAYQNAISVLKKGPPEGWCGARPLGLHFEGPFLNPAKKGAHNPSFLRLPDEKFIEAWTRKNGVLMVTMSPELPGAHPIASKLQDRGIVISAGHSMATFDEAQKAIGNGFTCATHLFNAMPPLDHRSPALTGAVLMDDRISAGLIADGIHVHPSMLDLAWRLKGPGKILLVSDAVGGLGMQPGSYVLGGLEVVVDDSSVRLRDGTLAGSGLRLDQALQNMLRFTHAPLEQVLPALSRNQARLLHLEEFGEIKPGFQADLTFLKEDGSVEMTMVGGELIRSSQ